MDLSKLRANSLWLLSEIAKSPYSRSLVEVLFALVVSNAAFLLSMFVYVLIQDKSASWEPIWATVKKEIGTNEIFVYILGFLAPAMWIMVSNVRIWRHVGFLLVLLVLQIIVLLTTAVIFSLSLAEILKNAEFANLWAWGSLGVALVIWYATLVYEKKVLRTIDERIEKPRPGNDSGAGILKELEADR